jgi:hypothetical protein
MMEETENEHQFMYANDTDFLRIIQQLKFYDNLKNSGEATLTNAEKPICRQWSKYGLFRLVVILLDEVAQFKEDNKPLQEIKEHLDALRELLD